MNELLENIRDGAHWRVLVRPGCFDEHRVQSVEDLLPILRKASVRFRGLGFPLLGNCNPAHFENHIQLGTQHDPVVEFWQFYQSGQFIHYSGLVEDRLQSRLGGQPIDWEAGRFLDPIQVVFRLTEIYEFAYRLSRTAAADEYTSLEISIHSINGRILKRASNPFFLPREYPTNAETLSFTDNLSNLELAIDLRNLALKPALKFFESFGWEPSESFLRELQTGLLEKSPWATATR